jgi:hypothetical protein
MKTRVWTVTCPQCHLEIFSRARHDYRLCGCDNQTMVDGGFAGYVRYGGNRMMEIKESFRYRFVNATKVELYEDWNYGRNKFGIIAAKKGAK